MTDHKARLDLHRGHDPIIFNLIHEFVWAGFDAPPLSKIIYTNETTRASSMRLKLAYKHSIDKIELGDFGPEKVTVTFDLDSLDPAAMTMALLKINTTTPFTVEEIDT